MNDEWNLKIINRVLKQAQLSLLQPIFQKFFVTPQVRINKIKNKLEKLYEYDQIAG